MGCNLLLPPIRDDWNENRRVAPPSELARRWDLDTDDDDASFTFIVSDDVVDKSGGGVVGDWWWW